MATVRFYLKKSVQKEASIYLKFTVDRDRRFGLTLDEKIELRHWNKRDQVVKGTHPRHLEINLYLQQKKIDLLNLWSKNRELDFNKFRALATERRTLEKKTLFVALSKFIEAYKSEKDSKTVEKFLTLERHLIKFDNKILSIDFETLDFGFYDEFKKYLLAIPNPLYKNYRLLPSTGGDGEYNLTMGDVGDHVGIFDDNVYAYLTQLKTFINWSEKRGYQVNDSHKTWEIIKRVYPPISLTMSELETIENFQFTEELIRKSFRPSNVKRIVESLNIARDYLVFECRTGQRISDIKRFNLRDYSNGKWTFTPRKGNRLSDKQVSVYFKGYCANVLDILQKYNWTMPNVSEQKINDSIKTACKLAGIDSQVVTYRWAGNKRVKIEGHKYEFLSTHSGRKSFITLALQAGLPVEYVMTLTGITSYKTIRHYKGQFEDSVIEKYLEGIQESKSVMKKAQ